MIKAVPVVLMAAVILPASVLTTLQYSQKFPVLKSKIELYEMISVNARKDQLLVTSMSLGPYYYTGVNTLFIFQPDELATLRPLIDAENIHEGLHLLINDLKAGSILLPAEQNSFWYAWYMALLDELPELRILHNPHIFQTVDFRKWGWYFFNLVNDTLKPYGVLDVVVRGDNPTEEASLFLPYDYGQQHTFFAYSHEGVKLIVFLYFPHDLIEKTKGEITYNLTVRLRSIEVYKDPPRHVSTPKVLNSQSSLNISKIVQLESEMIKGNDDTWHTAIRIDEIEVHVQAESFQAYFRLLPKTPSITFPGTWLDYFPNASGYWHEYRWDHLGANLIETNASLIYAN